MRMINQIIGNLQEDVRCEQQKISDAVEKITMAEKEINEARLFIIETNATIEKLKELYD